MGLSTVHISPEPPRATNGVAEYMKDHRHNLTLKEDIFYIEMADGVENEGGVYKIAEDVPSIEISVGGSLAVVKTGLKFDTSRDVGGIRGDISGYSSASRRRMMRLISSTERSNRPLFVTLTYPDIYNHDHTAWKRDIDVFSKRFARSFEDSSFIWRIEFKERKSGSCKGEIAPHFHLLAWGIGLREARRFIGKAWYEVVGSGSKEHRKAGVSVERVRGWRGTISYTSKYIAKSDTFPAGWNGRVWGAKNREKMPIAPKVMIMITQDVATKCVRLGRKFIGAGGRSFLFGLTWIVNGERMLDYLEFLDAQGSC